MSKKVISHRRSVSGDKTFVHFFVMTVLAVNCFEPTWTGCRHLQRFGQTLFIFSLGVSGNEVSSYQQIKSEINVQFKVHLKHLIITFNVQYFKIGKIWYVIRLWSVYQYCRKSYSFRNIFGLNQTKETKLSECSDNEFTYHR